MNPTSNRPYTVSMIENAMREVHFSVHPSKAAKAQALELIPRLKAVMPISRASMQLRVACSSAQGAAVQAALRAAGIEALEDETWTGGSSCSEYGATLLVDPGLFRAVEELLRSAGEGSGRVEVLQMSVQQEGEADIDLEAARKAALRLQQQAAEAVKQGQQSSSTAAAAGSETEAAAAAAAHSSHEDTETDDADEASAVAAVAAAAAEAAAVQPKQATKSKKAKRREKEEAAEREQRAAESSKRQDERRSQKAGAAAAAAAGEDTSDSHSQADSAANSSSSQQPSSAAESSSSSSSRLKCNTCSAVFADTSEYREHFKSDWHRYNLKLKMKKLPAVSADEFRTVDAEGFFFQERS